MSAADTPAPVALSKREAEILPRLGKMDKQIAAELCLTTHGVRHHIRKLFAKLGVHRRADAVQRAREMGLLSSRTMTRVARHAE